MVNVNDILLRSKAIEKKCVPASVMRTLPTATHERNGAVIVVRDDLAGWRIQKHLENSFAVPAAPEKWATACSRTSVKCRYDKYLAPEKAKAVETEFKGDKFEREVVTVAAAAQEVAEVRKQPCDSHPVQYVGA
jgi:hypothetical protein